MQSNNSTMPKVAAIQMVSSANVTKNLDDASELIDKAVTSGAKLICLPENFAFFAIQESDKQAIKEQEGQGLIQDFMKGKAREHGIYVVGGTMPIACDDPKKTRATCFVYDPKGNQIARYDKIHLFDVCVSDKESYTESDSITKGDQIVTKKTTLGTLGLSVCYDVRFPELYRQLLTKGADILVIPSAFTYETGKAHWEILLRARAIENLCYVIAPNQGGVHQNKRHTYGHSMIIDYWGRILATHQEGPGILTADLDLDALHKQRHLFPATDHRVFP